MTVSVIGKRYAKALLGLTPDAGAAGRAGSDLKDFAASWAQSRELRAVFENPGINQDTRRQVLREIARQTGMLDQVRDLLLLLSDRRRMQHVPEVADAFEAMAEARSGRVRAEVTTASSLPPGYFGELERVLREVTGKQVVLQHKVDPSLIGGVVTRIGDQVYDGSLKSRLSEIKEELLG
jgi:F-type H+-transporting ATPase subunit delta